jgi:hypothetical protein
MTHEILTAEELAKRLKIGRSTLFEWLSKDVFIMGKHYLREGRVLRFVWSDDIVKTLLERSAQPVRPQQAAAHKTKPTTTQNTINLDY